MLKLCGISIPASSVLEREKELEVLAKCIPSDPQARKRYERVDVYCTNGFTLRQETILSFWNEVLLASFFFFLFV